MPKINPSDLKADWSRYALTPVWCYVTSAELAKVLGLHLQTLANYRIRGVLESDMHPKLKGNKRYYKISRVMAWMTGKTEVEITSEWMEKHLPASVTTVEQAQYLVKNCHKVLGVEKGRFFYN